MPNNPQHHAVILDSRTQRVVRLGHDFAAQDGYHSTIVRSKGPDGKDSDYMEYTSPKGSYRVKVTGLKTPPDTGEPKTLTDPSHQFPVVLDPSVHRVIPLDTELSGDPKFSIKYTNTAAAGAPPKDVLNFTPKDNGGGNGGGTGGKLPPDTGA